MPADCRQSGAALATGLVLLLALTLLGIAGVETAALELRMAGNDQAAGLAFEAAESGLEVALAGRFDLAATVDHADTPVGAGAASFTAQLRCIGLTRLPPGSPDAGLATHAIHFDATATGRHRTRAAAVTLTRGVYIPITAPAAPATASCSDTEKLCQTQFCGPGLALAGYVESFWVQTGVD